METIKLLKKANVVVFAKVVVTETTTTDNIGWYAKELKKIDTPLAIQAVTPHGSVKETPKDMIFEFTKAAAEHLPPEKITFSFQAHKIIGVL